MNRARIIEMAKEADPEWLLPHPDVCADEVAALERFAALVLAQAMEPDSGSGHSAVGVGQGSYGSTDRVVALERKPVHRWTCKCGFVFTGGDLGGITAFNDQAYCRRCYPQGIGGYADVERHKPVPMVHTVDGEVVND